MSLKLNTDGIWALTKRLCIYILETRDSTLNTVVILDKCYETTTASAGLLVYSL